MNKLIRCMMAAVVTSLLLFSASRANANTVAGPVFTCAVLDVGWDGRVFVDCANTSTRFFSYASIACPAGTITHNMDDMKMFESLAVSALLSGKSLVIKSDAACEGLAGTNVGAIQNFTILR